MVSMFTSSVGSSLGKINDYKIVICYFFTKNSALKSKNKDWLWLNNNKMNCELMLTYDTPALRQTGSRYDGSKNASHDMGYLSCNNVAPVTNLCLGRATTRSHSSQWSKKKVAVET